MFKSYSALGSNDRPWKDHNTIIYGPPAPRYEVLEHPKIKHLAEKYKKTEAQIVLRWHLEMGGSMLAKSVTPSRIKENYEIFDFSLEHEDLFLIDDMNIGWRHLVFYESIMHPDYPFKECIPHGCQVVKPGSKPSFVQ